MCSVDWLPYVPVNDNDIWTRFHFSLTLFLRRSHESSRRKNVLRHGVNLIAIHLFASIAPLTASTLACMFDLLA